MRYSLSQNPRILGYSASMIQICFISNSLYTGCAITATIEAQHWTSTLYSISVWYQRQASSNCFRKKQPVGLLVCRAVMLVTVYLLALKNYLLSSKRVERTLNFRQPHSSILRFLALRLKRPTRKVSLMFSSCLKSKILIEFNHWKQSQLCYALRCTSIQLMDISLTSRPLFFRKSRVSNHRQSI